jgi:hypothetical protein
VFASCHELSVACTPPDLGLPADVLDHLGWCFQAQLQRSTDIGRIPIGPGPFDQDASGMGVTSFGDGTLPALIPRGIFRGDQAQAFHQLSWGIGTGEIAHVGHHGHGCGTLHPAQGLKGVDHRVQAPRFDLLLQFLLQTLEPFGVFVNRGDVCLKDDWLRRRKRVRRCPIDGSNGCHHSR